MGGPCRPPRAKKLTLCTTQLLRKCSSILACWTLARGSTAKANVAVSRTRGDEKQLVGEFAYQCKFKRQDELQAVAMKRCEQFFCSLQLATRDWVSLSTTKTGAVYRLKGNPPQAHE